MFTIIKIFVSLIKGTLTSKYTKKKSLKKHYKIRYDSKVPYEPNSLKISMFWSSSTNR